MAKGHKKLVITVKYENQLAYDFFDEALARLIDKYDGEGLDITVD